jgi:hypothetical protein
MLNCSIFCWRQKIPPRGVEPLSKNSKAPVNKQLTKNTNSVLATCLDNLVQIYPDLAVLVKVWPETMLDNNAKTRVSDTASTIVCNCALHIFHPLYSAQLRILYLIEHVVKI